LTPEKILPAEIKKEESTPIVEKQPPPNPVSAEPPCPEGFNDAFFNSYFKRSKN